MIRGMMLLAVSLLVGSGGCGPGVSSESSASPSSSHSPVAAATGASNPSTEADAYRPVPAAAPMPGTEQTRIVPDWMQAALTHHDTQVRLQALERWMQQGRQIGVEPLMVALNDPDEWVRTRALQLIEQDWVAEQAAKP
jgi:hypothetical protein